jgi:hypothetical protein
LEITCLTAGPTIGRLLAEQSAAVIKIQPPLGSEAALTQWPGCTLATIDLDPAKIVFLLRSRKTHGPTDQLVSLYVSRPRPVAKTLQLTRHMS